MSRALPARSPSGEGRQQASRGARSEEEKARAGDTQGKGPSADGRRKEGRRERVQVVPGGGGGKTTVRGWGNSMLCVWGLGPDAPVCQECGIREGGLRWAQRKGGLTAGSRRSCARVWGPPTGVSWGLGVRRDTTLVKALQAIRKCSPARHIPATVRVKVL